MKTQTQTNNGRGGASRDLGDYELRLVRRRRITNKPGFVVGALLLAFVCARSVAALNAGAPLWAGCDFIGFAVACFSLKSAFAREA